MVRLLIVTGPPVMWKMRTLLSPLMVLFSPSMVIALVIVGSAALRVMVVLLGSLMVSAPLLSACAVVVPGSQVVYVCGVGVDDRFRQAALVYLQ